MHLDDLPPEILVHVLLHVASTADLARLATVSTRLRAAATDVRATRARHRGRHGPHADAVGCAHQLVNAIVSDDVEAMIEALDVGSVNIDDLLDIGHLQRVAVPNVICASHALGEGNTRTVFDWARETIGTKRWDALGVAVIHGSAACVRALVSLGARADRVSADCLIEFVLTHTAWDHFSVYAARALSPRVTMRSAWPRIGQARVVDPLALLGPLLKVCRDDDDDDGASRSRRAALRPYTHLTAAREAFVRRASVRPNGAQPQPIDSVPALIDDARCLVALLVRHGCRPRREMCSDGRYVNDRWCAAVFDTHRPPSAEQVAAWRIAAASISEHESAVAALEAAQMAARDEAMPNRANHLAVRDILAAIVDAYDSVADT